MVQIQILNLNLQFGYVSVRKIQIQILNFLNLNFRVFFFRVRRALAAHVRLVLHPHSQRIVCGRLSI